MLIKKVWGLTWPENLLEVASRVFYSVTSWLYTNYLSDLDGQTSNKLVCQIFFRNEFLLGKLSICDPIWQNES